MQDSDQRSPTLLPGRTSLRTSTTSGRRLALGLGLATALVSGAFVAVQGKPGHGQAAEATPPLPPTYLPSPIPGPPNPPTAIPSPTSTVVTPLPSATPVATARITPTAVAAIRFTLDAARVSHVNNPGDLSGLAAVRPGTKVWLMMYYTVTSISKNLTRTVTYELQTKGKTFYRSIFKTTAKVSDGTGRFSRFDEYQFARTQPYGDYALKVTLTMGSQTQTTVWKFSIAKQERAATVTKSKHG